MDWIDVDLVHDEIFLPGGDQILVFSRTGNGDVPPLRVIRGPDTQLDGGVKTIAVDPVRNLIVAAGPVEVGSELTKDTVGTALAYWRRKKEVYT